MSIEKGRAYFRALGMEDRVREFTGRGLHAYPRRR